MTFEYFAQQRRRVGAVFLAAAAAFSFAAQAETVTVVSPPNPHVFPLLIALEENPDLDVELLPISGGKEIEGAFENGADVLLAMTYIGAKQRMTGAVPDLQLILPVTWRGFWEVTTEPVDSFEDLIGETVIVSGPAGSGAGGGGDIIFRAAALRQGVDPDVDLDVVYMPVSEAQAALENGEAAAIAVPAPASSGLTSFMVGYEASIDFQDVFSGYRSFPQGRLPLGGVHVSAAALADPQKAAVIRDLVAAYGRAVEMMEHSPRRAARIVADAFEEHYKDIDAPKPPAMVIARALRSGDLVYETSIPLASVERDLGAWIEELLGEAPDAGFFNTEFLAQTRRIAPAPAPSVGRALTSPRERMRERMRRRFGD